MPKKRKYEIELSNPHENEDDFFITHMASDAVEGSVHMVDRTLDVFTERLAGMAKKFDDNRKKKKNARRK